MVRIYKVKFGDMTYDNVVASNVNNAIRKALRLEKGMYKCRIQDIDLVELIVEA